MTTDNKRPVVCRTCGKVNRKGGATCERCEETLLSEPEANTVSRTTSQTGRTRLVTREADDGSLEMVEVTEEEAADPDLTLTPEQTAAAETPPKDEMSTSQRRLLFAAVAGATVLVLALAWPTTTPERSAPHTPRATNGNGAEAGTGPRQPRIPPRTVVVPVEAPGPKTGAAAARPSSAAGDSKPSEKASSISPVPAPSSPKLTPTKDPQPRPSKAAAPTSNETGEEQADEEPGEENTEEEDSEEEDPEEEDSEEEDTEEEDTEEASEEPTDEEPGEGQENPVGNEDDADEAEE